MLHLSCECLIVCCLLQSSLSVASLREELLNEGDLKIVKLRGYRNTSFTSSSDKSCLLVASDSGCTRWKHQDCRTRRSVEVYDPECSLLNGRRVKNCKVQNDFVPAENVVSVCGIKWTRDCQGPCFNCPESCKAQFEKTCWRNQQIKSAVNIISINGVDIYTEKEYLESLYSCSQNKVADVCAPKNCRFIESPEDCAVQNNTKLVDLQTRTCNLCTARIQEERKLCNQEIHEDCRNEFPFAWAKLCSREESHSRDLAMPVSKPEEKNEIMADFAALYSKSLGPVNSLILKTLKNIDVDEVSNGTVVVISTQRPFNEDNLNPSLQKFEISEEMIHSSEHLSVNVNVKYDFTDKNPPKALQHKPSNKLRPRTAPLISDESLITQIIDLTDDFTSQELTKAAGSQADNTQVAGSQAGNTQVAGSQAGNTQVAGSQADNTQVARSQADNTQVAGSQAGNNVSQVAENQAGNTQVSGSQAGNSNSQTRDNVYFDQYQTLNDRERNELSGITLTTARYQQPTFVFNTKTSSQIPTMTTKTTTTSTTTTTTTSTTTTTTTSTTTTTALDLSTTIQSKPSSTRLPLSTTLVPSRRKLTAGDLLKLCWMNQIGCDFNYEEAMTANLLTTSRPITTTRRPTTTPQNNNTGLSAMEKVRLCFKFAICSEEEFQEVALRGRESVLRQPRNGDEERIEPPVILTTTTTRRPRTTTESQSYKELKARAAQCFWKGIC